LPFDNKSKYKNFSKQDLYKSTLMLLRITYANDYKKLRQYF